MMKKPADTPDRLQDFYRKKYLLKEVCLQKEQKLKEHWNRLQDDPAKAVIQALLPGENGVIDKAAPFINLLNETILPTFFGFRFGKQGSGPYHSLFKFAQALIIAWSFRFFKRKFRRKKKETTDIP